MFKSSRLLDCLILVLGLAVFFDASVQLRATEPRELVWQPVTDTPDELEIQAIDNSPIVFVA